MKTNEHDYYSDLANWSFEDINYTSEIFTNWSFEEEIAKRDEAGKVARLYINRVRKGMLLQADPTVKFALGDFKLRRIWGYMLKTDSPYNTYVYKGLPPGPIRFVEKRTIDAVLDAPSHPYIYMCAKEDFSGYHNFTASWEEHKNNARRYQRELNRRGIKKY